MISVLLRENHRHYEASLLPQALLARNRGVLKGGLRALRVKEFSAAAKSRAGQSKEGWRTVIMEGDAFFMEALKATRDDHKFSLGSSFVFIRGGERKANTSNQKKQATHTTQSQPPPRSARGRGGYGARSANYRGNRDSSTHSRSSQENQQIPDHRHPRAHTRNQYNSHSRPGPNYKQTAHHSERETASSSPLLSLENSTARVNPSQSPLNSDQGAKK